MRYRLCRRRAASWRWLRARLREAWQAPEPYQPRPGTYYGHYGF